MTEETLTIWIQLAGVAQLAMVGAGMLAPKLLDWSEHLGALPAIIRQMFWTYGGYILATNLFFGILCLAFPETLLEGTPGAIALCLYLLLFWLGRIFIQFTYFDRTALGTGGFMKCAEAGLVLVLIFLNATYTAALWFNWGELYP